LDRLLLSDRVARETPISRRFGEKSRPDFADEHSQMIRTTSACECGSDSDARTPKL
jgi:hypothetical protein